MLNAESLLMETILINTSQILLACIIDIWLECMYWAWFQLNMFPSTNVHLNDHIMKNVGFTIANECIG